MVLIELCQHLGGIDRDLDSPQVNQPCIQAEGHGKCDSAGFAAAENRAHSSTTSSELHVVRDRRDAQNSLPEQSVPALPHSPLPKAGEPIEEYQEDESPHRGEPEV